MIPFKRPSYTLASLIKKKTDNKEIQCEVLKNDIEIQCNFQEDSIIIPDPDDESNNIEIELLEDSLDSIKVDANTIIIKTDMRIERSNIIEPFFLTDLKNSINLSLETYCFGEDLTVLIFSNGTISFSFKKLSEWEEVLKRILSELVSIHNKLVAIDKYIIESHKKIIIDDNFMPNIISTESNYLISFELGYEINFYKFQDVFKIGTKFSIKDINYDSIINYQIISCRINDGGMRRQIRLKLNPIISFVIFSTGKVQVRKKTRVNNIGSVKPACSHFLSILKHFQDRICL